MLGIDDFALRKGQKYGTILVDLQQRHLVDLLPEREKPTIVAWLKAHPGIELISRDRGGSYAEAARLAAWDLYFARKICQIEAKKSKRQKYDSIV